MIMSLPDEPRFWWYAVGLGIVLLCGLIGVDWTLVRLQSWFGKGLLKAFRFGIYGAAIVGSLAIVDLLTLRSISRWLDSWLLSWFSYRIFLYGLPISAIALGSIGFVLTLPIRLSYCRTGRSGDCPRCGYDRTGLEQRPCPECGHPHSGSAQRSKP